MAVLFKKYLLWFFGQTKLALNLKSSNSIKGGYNKLQRAKPTKVLNNKLDKQKVKLKQQTFKQTLTVKVNSQVQPTKYYDIS